MIADGGVDVRAFERLDGTLAVTRESATPFVGDPTTVSATFDPSGGQSAAGRDVTFQVYRESRLSGLPAGYASGTPVRARRAARCGRPTPPASRAFTYTGEVVASDIVVACLAYTGSCLPGRPDHARDRRRGRAREPARRRDRRPRHGSTGGSSPRPASGRRCGTAARSPAGTTPGRAASSACSTTARPRCRRRAPAASSGTTRASSPTTSSRSPTSTTASATTAASSCASRTRARTGRSPTRATRWRSSTASTTSPSGRARCSAARRRRS